MTPEQPRELRGSKEIAYDLRLHMNRAVSQLRQAEDIARLEMPAWPTADRIRSIYEQITADLLNGRKNVPPIQQRLDEAEQKLAEQASKVEALVDGLETIEAATRTASMQYIRDVARAALRTFQSGETDE